LTLRRRRPVVRGHNLSSTMLLVILNPTAMVMVMGASRMPPMASPGEEKEDGQAFDLSFFSNLRTRFTHRNKDNTPCLFQKILQN
jgi:hypothetical protein